MAEQDVVRLEGSAVNITTEVGSIESLLATLSQLIRDNVTDPARLNSIADSLDSSKARLSAAVVAHTPAGGNATPPSGSRR